MIGLISEYNPETQTGTVTIGKESFPFDLNEWLPEAPPEQGDEVVFDLRGVNAYNINLRGAILGKEAAVKYKYLAIVLALFLGCIGVHRFYLGFYRIGIIQIVVNALLMVIGLPGYAFLWGFVEAILLFAGHMDKDALGRPLK